MKKNGLKKKSLTLAAAVVTALEVGSVAGNMWTPMVNVAEAAKALTNEEREAAGYPNLPGVVWYDDGTSSRGEVIGYDEDSAVFWGRSYRSVMGLTIPFDAYNALNSKGDSCQASKGASGSIDYGGGIEGISDAGGCANLFKSAKGLIVMSVSTAAIGRNGSGEAYRGGSSNSYIAINAPSTGASTQDTHKHLKESGIDVDSENIKINKSIDTKDINADGDIHGKGNETIDGKIHGKGDIEVDGKATLHGNTVVEGNTTIKGNTVHEGDTTNKGKTINQGEVVNETTVTNKGDVINEANVTTKGTTTHEGEVINKSLVTNESDVHTKGNEIIDGNVTIHGNTTIDGTTTLKGDTVIGDSAEDKVIINGTAEFKENTRFDKDVTVKGSQTIEQNLRVKGDSVTEGNSVVKGNSTVEGDATIKGSTTLGDDKNADVLEVNAKTNIHGDTTIGDSPADKFTVNATSEFKSDATFDQNVLVKGDQTVEGNSHTKGNAEVDKDLAVHGSEVIDGDSVVHGDSTVDGKFHAKSNAEFDQNVTIHGSETVDGDSHIKGNIEVDKDMTVHGAMVVEGKMEVSDDFGTKGNMTVDKTLTVGGDAHISGDTILDGKFFAKGTATFGDSVDIAKNLMVGGNAHVIGDSVVDGDSYARSFNIGNEKYIDSNGINANGHKIRNVADGEISPNSLDAVNGRQLYHTREALQHNIDQVGAQTAAMANLHPMDFEYGDKFSLAAAVGGYQNQQAFALGAFMKPTQKSMVSLTGTLGMSQNMYGIGYTQKFGKKSDFEHMTETQLKDELMKLDKDAAEIREHDKQMREENSKLKAEVFDLKSEIAKTNKQATAQENKIAALTAKNADMEKAYNKLMSKVDGMATELATLKAASQK